MSLHAPPTGDAADRPAAFRTVVARTFPGGRVRLPRLDEARQGERAFTIVGTAFIREKKTPVPDGPRQSAFTEYFTYESLFEESPECHGAGDDPYEVLGVGREDDWPTIVAAHRRLIRAHHPDRAASHGPEAEEAAERKTKQLNEAFERLSGHFGPLTD